ncbi:MAG: hypothetical protein KDB82_12505 [Planctomycetes bacterium]|nr:hypothetical protein [Planctomycetota bacterium]
MQVLRVLIVAALISIGGAQLSATLAVKLDVATLTEKSDLVVIGKVDSKEARWDAGKKGIWTHHDVSVSETLKGKHEKTRDVVTRGGVVGTTGQNVSGSAKLEVGTEYVFFLWKDDDGRYRVQGMAQGAFQLETREGVKYAKNSLAGLSIVDPGTLKPEKAAALDLKLADLKKKVADQQKNAKEGE